MNVAPPMVGLLALAIAPPLAADDIDDLVARYGNDLAACYAGSDIGDLPDCKGLLQEPCMGGEEGGETTLGMVTCTMAETRVWDGYLNAEYRESRAWAEAMDADQRTYAPEFANLADALLDAQRAWIAFRDAQCGLEYAFWGSGSMRRIAGASCALEMTADRAIALRGLREPM